VQTHATQTEQVGCSLAAGGWRPVSALTRVFPGRRPSVNAGPDLEIQKFWSCNAPSGANGSIDCELEVRLRRLGLSERPSESDEHEGEIG